MKEQHGFISERKPARTDEQPGLLSFGNYDLVRRLAVGGMGEVYLAHQRTAFGREVAVKIIRPDLVNDALARQRFLREAEVGSYLKHDHILSLLEFGEEQGRLFIVTPYIAGGTLAQRIERGPLSLDEVHELFGALLRAVAYLHKRNIVHRDLKPGNILLDKEEDSDRVYVRLIDFGIAAAQGLPPSTPLTAAEGELGTAAYMAPERKRGVAAASNDIYSLGVILYLMLTGSLPGHADDMLGMPSSLMEVVTRGIAADPGQRFATVEEFSRAFEYAYRNLSGTAIAPARVTPPVPRLRPTPPPVYDAATERFAPDMQDMPSKPQTFRDPAAREDAVPARYSAAEKEYVVLDRRVSTNPQLPAAPLPPGPQAGTVLPSLPDHPRQKFHRDDYDAPTSMIDDEDELESVVRQKKSFKQSAPLIGRGIRANKGSRTTTTKHASPLVLLFTAILVIVLLLGGVIYFALISAITANVTIAPRVQAVSNVFTLIASPNNKTVDIQGGVIPANALTGTQSGTIQGSPTGVSGCVLRIFECKQTVSSNDVLTLSAQLRPGLKTAIAQNIQKQETSLGVMPVGDIVYTDSSAVPNPPVGTVSPSMTLTLTEQGRVEYIRPQDVRTLALQGLQKKVPAHYRLINTMTQVGQPVIRSISANGDIHVAIAAAGVAGYQISQDDLAALQNHIKGLSIKDARAYLMKDPGLDANVTAVKVSYGNSVPGNTDQIKIKQLDPTDVPAIHLPPVTAASGNGSQ